MYVRTAGHQSCADLGSLGVERNGHGAAGERSGALASVANDGIVVLECAMIKGSMPSN